jgi:hypothetical protein
MKYIILALPLFFISCGTDKPQHQTGFADEHFASGDSLFIQIKAENGILNGESFRKNINLVCYLKGNVRDDGFVIFNEYINEGECFGMFKGKFNEFDTGNAPRISIDGVWQKPDTTKYSGIMKFNNMTEINYSEALKQYTQPEPTNTPNKNTTVATHKPKPFSLKETFNKGVKIVKNAIEPKNEANKQKKAEQLKPKSEKPNTVRNTSARAPTGMAGRRPN